MSVDLSDYLCEKTATVMALEYGEAFKGLTEKEKMYMYYMFKAVAAGWRITAVQVSKEAPYLISLFLRIFRKETGDQLKTRLLELAILTEEKIDAFLLYVYTVFGNMGNYRGFGDTKILPRATKEDFETIIHNSLAYVDEKEAIDLLWGVCGETVFSHTSSELRLGMEKSGVNTYYSSNITQAEVKLVQDYLDGQNIQSYNNRLFKREDGSFELRMASSECVPEQVVEYEGKTIHVRIGNEITSGDYAPLLAKVIEYLTMAKQYAANPLQEQFLDKYIESFRTGSLQAHIDGSALWTQDRKPAVENYIGFIENYRDPYGVRGEWEGFVAIINKHYTQILSDLVEKAPKLLALLPWSESFEKPVFLQPDFTSIDIVGYCGSGIPAGINIPNYDSVREQIGFKNVSLGNIINGKRPSSDKANFICDADQALFARESEAFAVQVGLHELLGHGSGLLFCETVDENGQSQFNFDVNMKLPDGSPITHWYKPGETWSGVFNNLSNTYEECRAECVGLYLSTFPEVLNIFGYEGERAEEMMYLNWLHQLQMSLGSLQAFDITHNVWTQAHCCARHVYLQVLLRNTKNLVWLEPIYAEDGKKLVDLRLHLDRTKIISEGRPAIAAFLRSLQLYKSTADFEKGSQFFNPYTEVDETFRQYRLLVLEKKKPRSVFMQPVLELLDGEVVSKSFDISVSGVIESTTAILGAEITEEDFLSCIYRE